MREMIDMQDLVSIIIPVYNVNPYIYKCLDSVINQTYKNIEILLIDDGSTDGSEIICDEYAANDSRIKVIHKENGGVSSARNIGLEISTGKYIIFVDADDIVSINYVTNLVSPLITGVDIVIDLPVIISKKRRIVSNIKEINGFSLLNDYNKLFQTEYSLALQSPCGKIYKKQILNRNNLKFNINIKYGEDTVFNLNYYKYISSYKLINKQSYFYYHRIGIGAVNSFSVQRLSDEVNGLREKNNSLIKNKYANYGKIHNMMIIATMNSVLKALFLSKESFYSKISLSKEIIGTLSREVIEPIVTNKLKQHIVLFMAKKRITLPVSIYYYIKFNN